jgi:hypothetical protein
MTMPPYPVIAWEKDGVPLEMLEYQEVGQGLHNWLNFEVKSVLNFGMKLSDVCFSMPITRNYTTLYIIFMLRSMNMVAMI